MIPATPTPVHSSENERRIAFMRELVNGENRRLARVFRFDSSPVLRGENCAEHTWFVCFICLNMWAEFKSMGLNLDRGVLLSKAILHDLDEMLTGDFPRPLKYFNPGVRNMLNEVSRTIFTAWASRTGFSSDLHQETLDAKEGPEGLIVKFADLVTVVSYVTEEFRMGNRLLLSKLGEVSRYMQEFRICLWEIQQEAASEGDTLISRVADHLLPYLEIVINMADEELKTQ